MSYHQVLILLFTLGCCWTIWWVFYLYATWKEDMKVARRVSRDSELSLSFGDIPDLNPSSQEHLHMELSHSINRGPTTTKHREVRRRSSRQSLTKERQCHSRRSLKSNKLDMDHVYLDFWSFLKVHVLVYPSLSTLAVYGLMVLRIRISLVRLGLIQPLSHDPAETAALILLELPTAINYQGRQASDRNIAIFMWPWITIATTEGASMKVNNLIVRLSLDTKRVVRATLDDVELSMKQCVTLLQWVEVAFEHPKIHALSNWGVKSVERQQEQPDIHSWSSIVTIGYNYFGHTGFARADPLFRFFGHLSPGNTASLATRTFKDAMEQRIAEHGAIVDLVPHSRLVRFIFHLRPYFLKQFDKYKHSHLFEGCDGEALFAGTVIHSIDHFCNKKIVKDALWLDVDCPKFGYMAEITRIALVGFTSDLPLLPFQRRFKYTKHPFYQAVYRKAASIDEEYADQMDTCIVK